MKVFMKTNVVGFVMGVVLAFGMLPLKAMGLSEDGMVLPVHEAEEEQAVAKARQIALDYLGKYISEISERLGSGFRWYPLYTCYNEAYGRKETVGITINLRGQPVFSVRWTEWHEEWLGSGTVSTKRFETKCAFIGEEIEEFPTLEKVFLTYCPATHVDLLRLLMLAHEYAAKK